MAMRRSILFLYAVAMVAGIVSATCFLIQGGFGGGHGDWDAVLWLLSLPWALIAWPEVVQNADFVRLTLLPSILNMLAITVLRAALDRRIRSSAVPRA